MEKRRDDGVEARQRCLAVTGELGQSFGAPRRELC